MDGRWQGPAPVSTHTCTVSKRQASCKPRNCQPTRIVCVCVCVYLYCKRYYLPSFGECEQRLREPPREIHSSTLPPNTIHARHDATASAECILRVVVSTRDGYVSLATIHPSIHPSVRPASQPASQTASYYVASRSFRSSSSRSLPMVAPLSPPGRSY